MTPNGKILRRRLPRPEISLDMEKMEEPQTETERKLAVIWCEALGLEQVGRRSQFFDLGGHSLLAAKLLSRTLQTFGVELSLQQLFEHPTLAGLAEHIDTLLWMVGDSQPMEDMEEVRI